MARKPRIEYPGALVHVMSRGNRGDRVFLDDDDRDLWLKTLGQACEKTGWWVHAYVLMDNRWIAEHLEMGHPVSIPKETRKIGEILARIIHENYCGRRKHMICFVAATIPALTWRFGHAPDRNRLAPRISGTCGNLATSS